MDFAQIRRITITALFSDDVLLERLVLKGGNALNLVYGLTLRTSLDLDFSMDSDFENVDEARGRLFRALKNRFDAVGYIVFDEQLEAKPRLDGEDNEVDPIGWTKFCLSLDGGAGLTRRRPEGRHPLRA